MKRFISEFRKKLDKSRNNNIIISNQKYKREEGMRAGLKWSFITGRYCSCHYLGVHNTINSKKKRREEKRKRKRKKKKKRERAKY